MSKKEFQFYCDSFFDFILSKFFPNFQNQFHLSFEDIKGNIKKLRTFRNDFEEEYKLCIQKGRDFLRSIHQGKSDFSGDLPSDYKELLGGCFASFERKIQLKREQILVVIDRAKVQINKTYYTKFDNIPVNLVSLGCIHPLELTIQRCVSYFEKYGFIRVEGPQVEDEYHNFDALGITSEHPARDSQDSFYINKAKFLLRTQTSPVQIRIMEASTPPIAVVSVGRVFRRDAMDASHLPYFFQMEGLLVDVGVTFIQLKTILRDFLKYLFGEHLSVRFRPDYFPFTEPSCEASVSCPFCHRMQDRDCLTCKGSGWVEILGAGMVHPGVLRGVGIDTKIYSGFAFGCGIERIAMILNSVEDIRNFYENDLDFLSFGI